jgi:aspartyl-tRNA(Asn)/glutamyl-tRNA(Gln) amidotransferase subunit C
MSEAGRQSGFDVAYVAHLARLKLTDDERQQLQSQLEQILAYVSELNEVDVTSFEPMTQAIDCANVMRADDVAPGLDHEIVMANAPEHRLGHFILPRIIE